MNSLGDSFHVLEFNNFSCKISNLPQWPHVTFNKTEKGRRPFICTVIQFHYLLQKGNLFDFSWIPAYPCWAERKLNGRAGERCKLSEKCSCCEIVCHLDLGKLFWTTVLILHIRRNVKFEGICSSLQYLVAMSQ